MEINGSQSIAAPRQKVWDALNDPAILKRCLPGCESVERVSPEEFRVIMAAAIGPLRARFNGTLKMTESAPPVSCVMMFEGKGGIVGFGNGSSSVSLAESAEGTTLSYSANAQVGGKLAQVGSRLIDNVARKMADDFFTAFRRQLVGEPETSPRAPAGSAPAKDAKGRTEPTAVPQGKETTAVALQASSQVEGRPLPLLAQEPGCRTPLVPAWWLAIAMVLGAATSLAGVLLGR